MQSASVRILGEKPLADGGRRMSILYVTEHGAEISVEQNCVKVKTKKNNGVRLIPLETLESINVLGKSQMTTQCAEACLQKGIPVSFFSSHGKYFGKLQSTSHVFVERQRQQAKLYHTSFALELGKEIMEAKLHNQEVLLQRYERNLDKNVKQERLELKQAKHKIRTSKDIPQLIGYEGMGARAYFKGLGKLVKKDFSFSKRTRRPPRDAFNSMLSLGYSLLMNEIYGKLENKGLNPYFGFVHQDRERHPTLASDMMEEWRPVIVDSTIMSLVNGNEISINEFYQDLEQPGIYLTKEGMHTFLKKLEMKQRAETKYLDYVTYATSFRRAIELQIGQLVKAIEAEEPTIYRGIRIR